MLANANHEHFSTLDTLACAYARKGLFPQAVKTQAQALEQAREMKKRMPKMDLSGYEFRLQLFMKKQAYVFGLEKEAAP